MPAPIAPTTRAGAQMRSARVERQLNQSELAAILGVDQGTVSKWETGAREPEPWRWRDVEKVLRLDRGTLMGWFAQSGCSTHLRPDLRKRLLNFPFSHPRAASSLNHRADVRARTQPATTV